MSAKLRPRFATFLSSTSIYYARFSLRSRVTPRSGIGSPCSPRGARLLFGRNDAQVHEHRPQELVLGVEVLARLRRAAEARAPGVVLQLLLPVLRLDHLPESLVPERELGCRQPLRPGEAAPRVVLGGDALLAEGRHRGEHPGLALDRGKTEHP